MALAGPRPSREHQPLFSFHEVQLGKLYDLCLIHARLKDEVEVGQELSLRQFCFPDPALDPPFDQGVRLYRQHPIEKFRRGGRLFRRFCELGVKSLAYRGQFQGRQVLSDPGHGLFRHRLVLHDPPPRQTARRILRVAAA